MKGKSEDLVRQALDHLGIAIAVYKPADDSRNWKPADYLLWIRLLKSNMGTFLEVKESPAKGTFPLRELRPAQRLWIRTAAETGIPYWLVVHWPQGDWTVSNAVQVLTWFDQTGRVSIPRDLLQTRFGVQTDGRLLPGTLKLAMLGES